MLCWSDILFNMQTTYEAVLRDNRIEWSKGAPRHLAPGEAVSVRITVLDAAATPMDNQGQEMAAALEQLAQSRTFAGFDAGLWEREMRAERPMPGRSE